MARSEQHREYEQPALSRRTLDPDPMVEFGRWYDRAEAAGIRDPSAMALATVSEAGWPEVRIVLMKAYDGEGIVFYTNLESAKARALAARPRAEANFFWKELDRQVRLQGAVEQVSEALADDYFARRPRGSQLGAWASRQSRTVDSRETLEAEYEACARRFAGRPVPRPPLWGGFRLRPQRVELWQGRPDRLHERFRYRLAESGAWALDRLAP